MYTIPVKDFNLDYTLGCGQVFRWRKHNNTWRGIIEDHMVSITQRGARLIVDSSINKHSLIQYFRLKDDLNSIYRSIGRDEFILQLIQRYRGLRLIKQDPWECLVSYMCSCNNTICNISSIIEQLSARYGTPIDEHHHAFPSFEELKNASEEALRKCKLGFRAKNLHHLLQSIQHNHFSLEALSDMSYTRARAELQKLRGVGPKIADCVLLFAFGFLEAFPVDTHIKRIMKTHYQIPGTSNQSIADFARAYFGEYCGYAQEYLYMSRTE
jgi:N-glycosylase/DNA lyase